MTSDAAVISKPASRITPLAPSSINPRITWRSERSFMSSTRFQTTLRGWISGEQRWCRWLSTAAAHRLWAMVTACRSPVKCRLMSSIGSTCE